MNNDITTETLLIISLVPLENHLTQMVHKHSIEGVRFRSAAMGNPSHEVPYIQLYLPVRPSLHNKHNISAYLQMTPLSKQLCTPGRSIDRTAISVGVQQLWGSCLAFSYQSKAMNKEFHNKVLQANLLMSPVAMGRRSSRPSDSVSTETRTPPSRYQRWYTRRHSQQRSPATSFTPSL